MIPVNGIHIEPTNICTLKCAGCARTRFIEKWPQHWKNHNLDIDVLMSFLDIDLSGIKINFCGNYGDPIYHPRFIEMVREVKNKDAVVTITTNGSYRKKEWWLDLCSVLDERDCVRFSIDGLPENFTEYRVNADWESIRIGIETCVLHPVKTIWKFIPFEFNQSDIDRAREISRTLGIDEFLLDPSDRYDGQTQHLIPNNELIGPRYAARISGDGSIDPKCYQGREHFITATGHYSPCCYIADHRFYYKTDFGKNQAAYDMRHIGFSEILSQTQTVEFFKNIPNNPPAVCQFNCPKS